MNAVVTVHPVPSVLNLPEIGMVVVAGGKRFKVTGINKISLNVLGEDNKAYKIRDDGRGVQPDVDQTWTAPTLPTFALGQVVQFVAGSSSAAKYPGHYVVLKNGTAVRIAKHGGTPARPNAYITVPHVIELEVVRGYFHTL